MPGTDSGEFHAIVSMQIQENRERLERLEAENRQLRKLVGAFAGVIGRITGQPQGGEPGDEVAAARRRKRYHAAS
jgi:hypothetical protein